MMKKHTLINARGEFVSNAEMTLGFGALSLILVSTLQSIRILRGGTFSKNFMVLFGMVMISSLAAGMTVMSLPSAPLTAAFTLFGTIAGYLAGTRLGNEGGRVPPRSEEESG